MCFDGPMFIKQLINFILLPGNKRRCKGSQKKKNAYAYWKNTPLPPKKKTQTWK